ncbi:glycosyltransferase [Acetobacter fallax]|uniref:Glycosyltransferase n=1 Tax=Acetobacter fallax TaxID=1737473 RepID=A0ABX0K6T1_9PROT|nr:glycosyltransferase [Acetobacter fallax]NHO32110.1 glycosyltransferase [Acetobacter fallax]NHO35619.1 glycosyltransferase [Acetobacter fallax]
MSATPMAPASWAPRFVRMGQDTADGPPVAILLSLFNGEVFLNRQLDSFLEQQHRNWLLLWRDDGSCDASRAILKAFQANRGAGRCTEIDSDSDTNIGIAASYWRLLEHVPAGYLVAFADQDDVWLPEKLSRGITALERVPPDTPALYSGRQILTDRLLNPLTTSPVTGNLQGVFSALAQNIATGCTIMLNEKALHLMNEMRPPPPFILHDWAAYLAVSAAGGTVCVDEQPVILYRQHSTNAVGAPTSWFRRAYAAIQRGPGVFMTIFRSNLTWLLNHQDAIAPSVINSLETIQRGMTAGTYFRRLQLLRQFPGLTRSGFSEKLLFRLWFIFG